MKGICEVCNKTATSRNKVAPRFCSRVCRGIGYTHSEEVRKSIGDSHRGKKFSASHKANHLKAIRAMCNTPERKAQLSAMKKGVMNPFDGRNGAGENNINCKHWWFIKNGIHYRFKSLNKFVRENTHLFSGDELTEYKTEGRLSPVYQATVMLRNLHLLKKNGEPLIPSFTWHGWEIGEKWAEREYANERRIT